MTSKTFVSGTVIDSDWLNDVDAAVYAATGTDTGALQSNQVGFTPAGTGASATTVQAKLRETISVKDFGAVGDGVTDDTAAIQAAINYCTDLTVRKQTLYFPGNDPAQSYKITSSLVIDGRLNIIGDGQFNTVIQGVGIVANRALLEFTNAGATQFCGISDITILGDNVCNGIKLTNTPYFNAERVYVSGMEKGLTLHGATNFSCLFDHVTFYNIDYASVEFFGFTGGGQWNFSSCTFTGAHGVYVDATTAMDSVTFYNCNWEQCVEDDLLIQGSVQGLVLDGCRSEGLDGGSGSSLIIDPAAGKLVRGLVITGFFWQTDAGNTYPIFIGGDVSGFSITANAADYVGFLGFVYQNGAGSAGIIAGNYCKNSPVAINTPRVGISVFNNYSDLGALPEYWGTATGGVTQSSYTASATGMTTVPTGTVAYTVQGNSVTMDIPVISGTSNATSFTLTGGPVAIRPATDKDIIVRITDNGSNAIGFARVKTTGIIELYSSPTGVGFTAAGTKAVTGNSISYTLT